MEEHILLGGGPPSLAPLFVGMHYIDMVARTKYVSTGKESVNDWGSPIVDTEMLQRILDEFDPYAEGPTLSFSKQVPVANVEGRRQVRVFPSPDVDGGRFIVINDDNNVTDPFYLDLMNVQALRDNEEISVFNGTIAPMIFAPEDDHELVLALSPTARGRNRGLVRFKLIRNLTTQKKLWVVTGDLEIGN